MNCFGIIIIFIIILVFIFVITSLFTFTYLRNKFRHNYNLSLGDFCRNVEYLRYETRLKYPKTPNYYYDLARYLLTVSLNITKSNCINKEMPLPPEFRNSQRLYGIHPYNGKKILVGVIFYNNTNNRVLIGFSGTLFLNEWATDFNFPLTYPTGTTFNVDDVQVHRGFYNLYMTIRQDIQNFLSANKTSYKNLFITGHSLGAALATLAAIDFYEYAPVIYTFASPRVGNVDFARLFNYRISNKFRINNIEDVITELPPPVILGNVYEHVSTGIPFNKNLGTIGQNHIESYIKYLPKCLVNPAKCDNETN